MNKVKGFTFAEALLVLVILGIIATICIGTIKPENTDQLANDTKGEKAISIFTQAFTIILTKYSSYDNFLRLNYNDNYISLANASDGANFVKLLKRHLVLNEHSLDTNQTWFSDPLIDYKKNVIGAKSDLYGNYIYLNDGVIAGFRFYDSCDATEINAVAPKNRIHYEIKKWYSTV